MLFPPKLSINTPWFSAASILPAEIMFVPPEYVEISNPVSAEYISPASILFVPPGYTEGTADRYENVTTCF